MSVSKLECNAEIFDFVNDQIYYKTVKSFASFNVNVLRHAFIPLTNENNNIYLFGFIGYIGTCNYYICDNNKIYFQKHIFNSVEYFSTVSTLQPEQKEISNAYGRAVSCFQTTTSKLIICFFMTKGVDSKVKFNLYKINFEFTNDKTSSIDSNIDDANMFLKCIHLKDNIGIFVSYTEIITRF